MRFIFILVLTLAVARCAWVAHYTSKPSISVPIIVVPSTKRIDLPGPRYSI